MCDIWIRGDENDDDDNDDDDNDDCTIVVVEINKSQKADNFDN